MKQLLFLSLLLLFPILTYAQIEIEVEPDPLDYDFNISEEDLYSGDYFLEFVAHANLTNVSTADSLTLVWVRKVVTAPEEWEYRVCDKTACFPIWMDTNWDPPTSGLENLVAYAPGDSGYLDLHLKPNLTPGCGEIDICIFDINDLDNPVKVLKFGICVTTNFTSVTEQEISYLHLQPNPTEDYLTLTGPAIVDQVIVYNQIGMRVKRFDATNDSQFDLSGLTKGIYQVCLLNEDIGVLKTFQVIKQ